VVPRPAIGATSTIGTSVVLRPTPFFVGMAKITRRSGIRSRKPHAERQDRWFAHQDAPACDLGTPVR
jgi:hypothetical protein